WTNVGEFGYGRELRNDKIDVAIDNHSSPLKVREDEVYKELDYAVGSKDDRATHGTEVMGIAAGNGNSLMGTQGVAPRADIIFVQLPPNAIKATPGTLSNNIVDGAHYVFKRARELNKKAAVVNISYGGYSGPHDGTSGWEMALDEFLNIEDRAVVVSAGNAFEADCHAVGTLQPGQESRLRWIVRPGDSTANDLEIWYNGDASLSVWLAPPDGSPELGPYAFGPLAKLKLAPSGTIVGAIEHFQHDQTNGDNSVTVALWPTAMAIPPAVNALALAPPGRWVVRLRNTGGNAAEFHAWIHRDDVAKRSGPRQQSRFVREDAYPGYTMCDFATGQLTISAGGFNAATDEVCSYSSCGPTRGSANNPARQKPDFCAPAEELATGGGVLTTGSRRAAPRRMNGTSAAAPHIAGIVALLFDHRRNYQKKHLTAAELRAALTAQTGGNQLVPDRRQAADQGIAVKQSDVWADLIGAGKISCLKSLDNL
ncbi:MAG: S8 family serine peptidase, partial [Tepidisphaeraceae bacterium]